MATRKSYRVTVRFDDHRTGYQTIVEANDPRQAERVARNQEGADHADCCCQVY